MPRAFPESAGPSWGFEARVSIVLSRFFTHRPRNGGLLLSPERRSREAEETGYWWMCEVIRGNGGGGACH